MKPLLKLPRVAALCALALCAATTATRAQSLPTRPEWGVQGAVVLSGGSDFGVGGRVRYPFTLTAPAPISAFADLNWFPKTRNVFDLNWNLVYNFVPHGTARPYAGGGVNVAFASGGGTSAALDLGLNAVGGFEFGRVGQLTPYLEGRYTFFSLKAFIVTFGVRF